MFSYQIWAFYQKCCSPADAEEPGKAFLQQALSVGSDLRASCIFVINIKNSPLCGISRHIYTLTPSQKPQEKLFFLLLFQQDFAALYWDCCISQEFVHTPFLYPHHPWMVPCSGEIKLANCWNRLM